MTKQILVIDDDAQTRRLVGLVLQRYGFRIVEAFDGVSALRLLEFTKPDLMIVDVMMPGIDGVEFCKRVRNVEQLAGIPIIAFTASGSSLLNRDVREAGADVFLPKTSPPLDLMKQVHQLLGTQTLDLSD